ncbi:MAG TPA: SEFIR domain-containing protein, partial [Thermoanaerobaculia bacterium]
MPKKVFVSYAQSSEAHMLRVAELVASLRAAGLIVAFDQDVTSQQGPPEGWPQWMLNQIEQADWVLVVCNEVYYRRFRGREEPGRGLGARWEGAIIGQALYNDGMLNRKFIPVLFDDETTAHIPEPLQGATYYRLPADLPKLTSALTGNSSPQGAAPPSPKKKKNPTATATRPRARQSAGWPEIASYALLSLGSFLCALVLVGLLLWKADLLARFGLT